MAGGVGPGQKWELGDCATKNASREASAGSHEHRLMGVERCGVGSSGAATERGLLARPAENAGKAGGWPSTERDLFTQMNDGGRGRSSVRAR